MTSPSDLTVPTDLHEQLEQARQLLIMLDAMGQHRSEQVRAIRDELVEIIESFAHSEDKPAAKVALAPRLRAVEVKVCNYLAESAGRMRDQVATQLRRMGKGQQGASTLRAAMEGLERTVEALEKMREGAECGDAALREQGRQLLEQAQSRMEARVTTTQK